MQCMPLLFLVFAFNMHSTACIEMKVTGRKGKRLECPAPHFSLYLHLPVLFLLLFLSLSASSPPLLLAKMSLPFTLSASSLPLLLAKMSKIAKENHDT